MEVVVEKFSGAYKMTILAKNMEVIVEKFILVLLHRKLLFLPQTWKLFPI